MTCIIGKVREYRVVWRKNYGELPKGMMIRHSCHNQRCCNIEHLSIGTASDNREDDMLDHPKWPWQPKGMDTPNNKLTDDDVRYIKSMKGKSQWGEKLHLKLAQQFNVNPSVIYGIWKGERWKHI